MSNNCQAGQSIHKRIRIAFDVDIEYNPLPLDGPNRELEQLQKLLLERSDLMDKLLVNQCLRALEEVMEGMVRQGGLLGFDEKDLLAAAARQAAPADVIPLLIAMSNGWEFEYTHPVTTAPVTTDVIALQAEDLGSGQLLDLDAPESPLLQQKSRNYLIAETQNAALAAANAFHSSRPSGDWVREVHRTIDLLAEDARGLENPLEQVEFTIYAATREDYEQVQAEVTWYCRQRLPGTRVTFGWFTLFAADSAVLEHSHVGD